VLRCQGDAQGAAACLDESLALYRALGEKLGTALSLCNLAYLALDRGDLERAGALFRHSLALLGEVGSRAGVPRCLTGLACVALPEGRPERAARLLGAAEAVRGRMGARPTAAERTSEARAAAAARASLGGGRFGAAWSAGRRLPPEEAIRLALASDAVPAAPAGAAGAAQAAPAEPPPTGRPASPAWPLTAREREVAVCIARGLTNREIAAELIITQRTAEAHVDHILAKLGVKARAQVAAWAVGRGLLDGYGGAPQEATRR
jgi:DNA-binding NarL/FixJ family response regulator